MKSVYTQMTDIYDLVDRYASDLYETWYLVEYKEDKISKSGFDCLSENLTLSKEELIDGLVHLVIGEDDWNSENESKIDEYRNHTDWQEWVFSKVAKENTLLQLCIFITEDAYIANGTTEKIETSLNDIKLVIEDLEKRRFDSKFMSLLNEYYDATLSFYNYCNELHGTFNEMAEAMSNYQNEVLKKQEQLKQLLSK